MLVENASLDTIPDGEGADISILLMQSSKPAMYL